MSIITITMKVTLDEDEFNGEWDSRFCLKSCDKYIVFHKPTDEVEVLKIKVDSTKVEKHEVLLDEKG